MELGKWIRAQWDRVLAWVCVAAGALVLIVGWVGVSRYAYPADQLPYIISGGVGGLFLLGLGAMLWLSADLRDEWRKLDEIDRRNARFYDSQHSGPTGWPEADDRASFAAPAAAAASPGPAPAMADDDIRESVAVGRSGAATSPASTTSQTPVSASRRRSGTGAKTAAPAGPERRASGRRAPKQGLAQP